MLSKNEYTVDDSTAPAALLERPMTEGTNGRTPNEAPDAAHYIASLVQELAALAKSHEFDALAYILEMARLEADQICKRGQSPNPLSG
jgi:hypothetical protein